MRDLSAIRGTMEKIIEVLKRIKDENDFTNADVAEMSGVPVGTVNRVFGGKGGGHNYATIEPIKEALLPFAKPEEVQSMHAEKNKILVGDIERLYEKLLDNKDKELRKCEKLRNISLGFNALLALIVIVFLFVTP